MNFLNTVAPENHTNDTVVESLQEALADGKSQHSGKKSPSIPEPLPASHRYKENLLGNLQDKILKKLFLEREVVAEGRKIRRNILVTEDVGVEGGEDEVEAVKTQDFLWFPVVVSVNTMIPFKTS